jgi:glycosyltransferase involved in cell wall biosynthesis
MSLCDLHVSLSLHYDGTGFTSAAVALAEHMPVPFRPILYIPQLHGALPAGLAHVRQFPPILPAFIAFRPTLDRWARERNEHNLLCAVRRAPKGTVVWLWPGASIDLQRELRSYGAIIFREMINTHSGTARRILDEEYGRVGLPLTHTRTQDLERLENEELTLCDYIISPSESVDDSLREWDVQDDRIIRATFGWSPGDFTGHHKADLPGNGLKVIFIGQVGIRKGIHLALEAWDRAKIDGTFFVVGREDPEIGPILAPYRNRSDIRFLPYTRDLGSLYRAADVMFFPSLEEGAPLVCYQAGGCGLPILTSPMGRGRLIQHEVTGLVIEPHDVEANARALRRLAEDESLRANLSRNVREKALKFDWQTAAAQRADAFSRILGI